MRKIRESSEVEMIAVFLAAELHSPRSMSQEIQTILLREALSPRVISSPDLSNAQENAAWRAVLGAYRGYGLGQGYFQGFPETVRWELVGLTRQEMEQVNYIDYDYWVELSGRSRRALDGARRALGFWTITRRMRACLSCDRCGRQPSVGCAPNHATPARSRRWSRPCAP